MDTSLGCKVTQPDEYASDGVAADGQLVEAHAKSWKATDEIESKIGFSADEEQIKVRVRQSHHGEAERRKK
jgi:hypothetical protein